MNREIFFNDLVENQHLFPEGLSDEQKQGLNTKLDVWAKWYAADHSINYLAACLGQIYHETGGKMIPVLETFAQNREEAAEKLEKAYAEGRLSWVKAPYWAKDESGKHPIGGGDIQLTHRKNYVGADKKLEQKFGVQTGLLDDYDRALDPIISAHIAFSGMIDGWFRECKLSDFEQDKKLDYCAARDIVNGDAGLIGEKIEIYCQAFETALEKSGAAETIDLIDKEMDWPKA